MLTRKDSLYSTNLNQRTRRSDKLFYDQYRFCFKFDVPYLGIMGKEFDQERVVQMGNMWMNVEEYQTNRNPGGSWRSRKISKPSGENLREICRIAEFFGDNREDNKIVLHKHEAYLYTNNPDLHRSVSYFELHCAEYTEMIINRPTDTVKSRYKGYTHRSYFKSQYITIPQKKSLMQFIDNNLPHIKINQGLRHFYNSGMRGMRDYFHFDSPGISYVTMCEMMAPGLIRKTLNIHYDK